jgi:hypothetical protein
MIMKPTSLACPKRIIPFLVPVMFVLCERAFEPTARSEETLQPARQTSAIRESSDPKVVLDQPGEWQVTLPAGSPQKVSRTFTLSYSGTNNFEWVAYSSAASSFIDGTNWITIEPSAGTLAQGQTVALTVSVDGSYIPPGGYVTTFVVQGVGSFESAVRLIQITATPSALLSADPPSLILVATNMSSDNLLFRRTLTIKNDGFGTRGGEVHLQPSVIKDPQQNLYIDISPYFKVLPSQGSFTFDLEVDARSLYLGNYSAAIEFWTAASNSPFRVPIEIRMKVAGARTLGLSSPSVRPGGSLLLYATVSDEEGVLNKSGTAVVKAVINGRADATVALFDNEQEAFPAPKDGVYTAWLRLPSDIGSSGMVEFYVDNAKQKQVLTFQVSTNKSLLVLTDLTRLYQEFLATGMAAGEDRNNNQLPDYFDLLQQLYRAASEDGGVVYSVDHEIPDYDFEVRTAVQYRGFIISKLIRDHIKARFMTSAGAPPLPLKAIAIVGDDAVIPFYRVAVPQFWSEEHLSTFNRVDTPVGRDSVQDKGYQMSDLRYGESREDVRVPTVPLVDPLFTVGRVFAATPSNLVQSLQSYRTPIVVDRTRSSAASFIYADPSGNAVADKSLVPRLRQGYDQYARRSPALETIWNPNTVFDYRGMDKVRWKASDVFWSLTTNAFTFLFTHANCVDFSGVGGSIQADASDPQTSIRAQTFPPGHVLLALACWSGLSYDAMNKALYQYNLASQLQGRGITFIAPTSFGGYMQEYPIGHDLAELEIMQAILVDNTVATMGEAFRQGMSRVLRYASVPSANPDRPGWRSMFSLQGEQDTMLYAYYGMAFYGWPSQRIDRGRSPEVQSSVQISTVDPSEQQSIHATAQPDIRSYHKEIAVEVPHLEATADSHGATFFRLVNQGDLMGEPLGPILPVLRWDVVLPPGSQVTDVYLTNLVSEEYPQLVQPAIARLYYLGQSGDPEERAMPGDPLTLTNLYPPQIFRACPETSLDGKVVLHAEMVPLQYNPQTGRPILYRRAVLGIEYLAPDAEIAITSLVVNNDQPLTTEADLVEAMASVKADAFQFVKLSWSVRRLDGWLEEAYTSEESLKKGTNNFRLPLHPATWSPGPKLLAIVLTDDSYEQAGVLATESLALQVAGLSIEGALSKSSGTLNDTNLTVRLRAYDEKGTAVAGLSSSWTFDWDGQALNLPMTEPVNGMYEGQIQIPVNALGVHVLNASLLDSRGFRAHGSWTFTVAQIEAEPVRLTIQRDPKGVSIAWSGTATNFVLQVIDRLSATSSWVPLTNIPVLLGTNYTVIQDLARTNQFYRLRQGP